MINLNNLQKEYRYQYHYNHSRLLIKMYKHSKLTVIVFFVLAIFCIMCFLHQTNSGSSRAQWISYTSWYPFCDRIFSDNCPRLLCYLFFFESEEGDSLLLVSILHSSICYWVLRSELWSSISSAVTAVPSSRYVMVVLSLVCSYDSFSVTCSPFDMLTDIASSSGALVVASVNVICISVKTKS